MRKYQCTAAETRGEVVFLHRLERGRASKSYGIQVALLAGLPPTVWPRAEVLARLERYDLDVFAKRMQSRRKRRCELRRRMQQRKQPAPP